VPRPVSERVWQDYMVMFADNLKSAVHDYAHPVPYTPSSPSANFEEPPDQDHNGDMHFWSVWHALAPPTDYLKVKPRFMSEFGFQSFPRCGRFLHLPSQKIWIFARRSCKRIRRTMGQ